MEAVIRGLASYGLLFAVNLLPSSLTKASLFWGLMLWLGLWYCSRKELLAWRTAIGVWALGGVVAGYTLSLLSVFTYGGGAASHSWIEVILLAPVAEETYYRGYLTDQLEAGLGVGWAHMISTLLFALAHGNAPAVTVAIAVGALCWYVSRQSASILPAISAHLVFNLLQVLS